MHTIRSLITFTAALFISGCTVFDKSDTVPSFVEIKDIGLHTRSPRECLNCEGSESNKIIDAWVIANGKNMGVFDLPATVPVPETGPTKITVGAGISLNGILQTREQYAFYMPYTTTLTLKPGSTVDFSEDSINSNTSWKRSYPVVEYFEDLKFFNENFQNIGLNIDETQQSDTVLATTSDPELAFDDNLSSEPRSGAIYLDSEHPRYEGILSEDFNFPSNGRVFVEIDYRSNCPIEFGLYSLGLDSSRVVSRGIKPKPEWNKIYLEMTQDIREQPFASGFQIFFQVLKPNSVADGRTFIDNIKVIYPDI